MVGDTSTTKPQHTGKDDAVAHDWRELAKLLKQGRRAGMDAEAYATLRDDVRAFAASGGTDEHASRRIRAAADAAGLVASAYLPPPPSAAVEKETAPAQPASQNASHNEQRIGHRRPAPQFTSKGSDVPATSRSAPSVPPDNLPTASQSASDAAPSIARSASPRSTPAHQTRTENDAPAISPAPKAVTDGEMGAVAAPPGTPEPDASMPKPEPHAVPHAFQNEPAPKDSKEKHEVPRAPNEGSQVPKPTPRTMPSREHTSQQNGDVHRTPAPAQQNSQPPQPPTPRPISPPAPTREQPIADTPTPIKQPVADGAVHAPATAIPTPASESPASAAQDHKARITEIKQTVNGHIGNPAQLDGEDKQLGIAYMRALLEAMKAGSGQAGSVPAAMQKLEAAFKAIMELPAGGRTNIPSAPQQSASDDVHTIPEAEQERAAAANPLGSVPSSHDGKPSTDTRKQADGNAVPVADTEGETREHPKDKNQNAETLSAIQKLLGSDNEPRIIAHTGAPSKTPKSTSLASDAGKENTFGKKTAEQKTEAAPTGEREADGQMSEKAPAGVTPAIEAALATPEIDQGLAQLLSEWPIFKGSGFLGMGGKGREHPLYQRLAPLPMSLVIAGNWKDAKKEDIFSIRDYTGGWLREQGVAYLPSESFEHYLRRVVSRILKRRLQTGK